MPLMAVMQKHLTKNNINSIRHNLRRNPRDLLLFDLALQSGIPVKTLLSLRVKDLRPLDNADKVAVKETGEKPAHRIIVTHLIRQTWLDYLAAFNPADDDFVFPSRKGSGPLNLSSVSNMVKDWLSEVGIAGPGPIRFLRRTWEHYSRREHGAMSPLDVSRHFTSSMSVLEPIHSVPVHESVYQSLFQVIISGQIPPGERLIPDEIARRMQVSRMPVREALHRLRAAGLVTAVRQKGITVNTLSKTNLNEIQQIRILMEKFAAETGARLCSEEALKRMEILHEQYTRSLNEGDVDRSVSINRDFHLTIYSEAKMPILCQMIEGLLDKISPYFHILLRHVDTRDTHIKRTIQNHQGMLEGMSRHDPAMVSRWLMVDHSETTERILSFF
jgi:DNA-binding GntR family transcriptional regulator